jgi:cytochrome b subunit of formate dehydrogenase
MIDEAISTHVEETAESDAPARVIVSEAQTEIIRFDVHQRIQHAFLMVTFILLALTGLPLKFHDVGVAQGIMALLGGADNARLIHHISAYIMVIDCAYHLLYIGISTFILKRPFPFKMVPSIQDGRNIIHEISYFLGIKKDRPRLDRFSWKEKFDYWAIFWGMPVIGTSGFILMYPVFTSQYLPDWGLTVAYIAHSDEAMLAVLWIAIVHMVFAHLAPHVFPMDKVMFTGKLAEDRYEEERPVEYEREFKRTDEQEE